MPRTLSAGRHELGQNFLTHQPTIGLMTSLVAAFPGSIIEIGAGDGAITRSLARLGRPLTAIDVDASRVRSLQRRLPDVEVKAADVLKFPLDSDVVVGNIPFHITTPILRRLLSVDQWEYAVLLTQWEVARKRAGVGGSTLLTAQSAPWFEFDLHSRVPARGFAPQPVVDGGVLSITRKPRPLVDTHERRKYSDFVHKVFTGPGGSIAQIVRHAVRWDPALTQRALNEAGIPARALPRDLNAAQWAALWSRVRRTGRREV